MPFRGVFIGKAMTERQRKYREYLKTEHWNCLRLAALKRDQLKCCKCKGGGRVLQVHHKFYRKEWTDTELEDLISLCIPCHKDEHRKLPTPQKPKGHPTAWYIKQDIQIRAFLKKRSKAQRRAKNRRKRENQLRASRRSRYGWSF